MEIKDILGLLGNELKDSSKKPEIFREFIEQEKWTNEQIEKWLNECINNNSSDKTFKRACNFAFQDLIISLGQRLGFEIEYGRYIGKPDGNNYDGIWKRKNGDMLVLEVKAGTWAMTGIDQLGEYINYLSKKNEDANIVGLYVIGKGEIHPLIQQILGSNYRDNMRIIMFEDLMKIVGLKEELKPAIGEKNAFKKVQNLLLPIESINIGNIVEIILEIATTKSEVVDGEEEIVDTESITSGNEPWTKTELLPYLKAATPYQRILLSAMVQADKEPVKVKTLLYLMNEIVKRKPFEEIDKKITGKEIAGARGGLTIRRKALGKEDIIWSRIDGDYFYKIKEDYKQIITEWVKNEGLWIKEEL